MSYAPRTPPTSTLSSEATSSRSPSGGGLAEGPAGPADTAFSIRATASAAGARAAASLCGCVARGVGSTAWAGEKPEIDTMAKAPEQPLPWKMQPKRAARNWGQPQLGKTPG